MNNADISSGLRKRLLYSSIGLAIVVSAIFISVAFNLSRDLGESLEFEHSKKILLQLNMHVKTVLRDGEVNELAIINNVKNELMGFLDEDVIGIEIWLNQKHTILKSFLLLQ